MPLFGSGAPRLTDPYATRDGYQWVMERPVSKGWGVAECRACGWQWHKSGSNSWPSRTRWDGIALACPWCSGSAGWPYGDSAFYVMTTNHEGRHLAKFGIGSLPVPETWSHPSHRRRKFPDWRVGQHRSRGWRVVGLWVGIDDGASYAVEREVAYWIRRELKLPPVRKEQVPGGDGHSESLILGPDAPRVEEIVRFADGWVRTAAAHGPRPPYVEPTAEDLAPLLDAIRDRSW